MPISSTVHSLHSKRHRYIAHYKASHYRSPLVLSNLRTGDDFTATREIATRVTRRETSSSAEHVAQPGDRPRTCCSRGLQLRSFRRVVGAVLRNKEYYFCRECRCAEEEIGDSIRAQLEIKDGGGKSGVNLRQIRLQWPPTAINYFVITCRLCYVSAVAC